MKKLVAVALLAVIAGCGQSEPKISQDDYNAISVGMSEQKVFSIFGEPDKVMMHMQSMGMDVKVYHWKNADGSTFNVSIGGGKVINKTQAGVL